MADAFFMYRKSTTFTQLPYAIGSSHPRLVIFLLRDVRPIIKHQSSALEQAWTSKNSLFLYPIKST